MFKFRRPWIIALVVGLVLAVIAGAVRLFVFGLHYDGMTLQQAENIAATLPSGSSRDEVESLLDAHGINHDDIKGAVKDTEGVNTVASLAGLDEHQVGFTIKGFVPNANLDFLFPCQISLYFFFDKKGKLLKKLVQPYIICP
jgi:predicted PurR-regulated permease PerM